MGLWTIADAFSWVFHPFSSLCFEVYIWVPSALCMETTKFSYHDINVGERGADGKDNKEYREVESLS